jgi:adenylate cyclase class 2
MKKQTNKETEVRFLEIDKDALIKKLTALGAVDKGEVVLEEVIIYDKDLKWLDSRQIIRLRKNRDKIELTYKHHNGMDKGEAVEIELEVNDLATGVSFLEKIGFVAYRRQEKRRHTLELDGVTFDIDTWPRIPAYVELEGESLEDLKKAAASVGLDWSKMTFKDARAVIEDVYNIPVGKMRWFTFDRFE